MLAAKVLPKFVEVVISEEQLGNDVVGARVDFFLKVAPIDVFALFARELEVFVVAG